VGLEKSDFSRFPYLRRAEPREEKKKKKALMSSSRSSSRAYIEYRKKLLPISLASTKEGRLCYEARGLEARAETSFFCDRRNIEREEKGTALRARLWHRHAKSAART